MADQAGAQRVSPAAPLRESRYPLASFCSLVAAASIVRYRLCETRSAHAVPLRWRASYRHSVSKSRSFVFSTRPATARVSGSRAVVEEGVARRSLPVFINTCVAARSMPFLKPAQRPRSASSRLCLRVRRWYLSKTCWWLRSLVSATDPSRGLRVVLRGVVAQAFGAYRGTIAVIKGW